MVIPNTCPNLSNIVHTDFELGRVIQTVTATDPGITSMTGINRGIPPLVQQHEGIRSRQYLYSRHILRYRVFEYWHVGDQRTEITRAHITAKQLPGHRA